LGFALVGIIVGGRWRRNALGYLAWMLSQHYFMNHKLLSQILLGYMCVLLDLSCTLKPPQLHSLLPTLANVIESLLIPRALVSRRSSISKSHSHGMVQPSVSVRKAQGKQRRQAGYVEDFLFIETTHSHPDIRSCSSILKSEYWKTKKTDVKG
jgi:hypothetical protein